MPVYLPMLGILVVPYWFHIPQSWKYTAGFQQNNQHCPECMWPSCVDKPEVFAVTITFPYWFQFAGPALTKYTPWGEEEQKSKWIMVCGVLPTSSGCRDHRQKLLTKAWIGVNAIWYQCGCRYGESPDVSHCWFSCGHGSMYHHSW